MSLASRVMPSRRQASAAGQPLFRTGLGHDDHAWHLVCFDRRRPGVYVPPSRVECHITDHIILNKEYADGEGKRLAMVTVRW
jgi:hypothetical protein